jgi:hypothetical protein
LVVVTWQGVRLCDEVTNALIGGPTSRCDLDVRNETHSKCVMPILTDAFN